MANETVRPVRCLAMALMRAVIGGRGTKAATAVDTLPDPPAEPSQTEMTGRKTDTAFPAWQEPPLFAAMAWQDRLHGQAD